MYIPFTSSHPQRSGEDQVHVDSSLFSRILLPVWSFTFYYRQLKLVPFPWNSRFTYTNTKSTQVINQRTGSFLKQWAQPRVHMFSGRRDAQYQTLGAQEALFMQTFHFTMEHERFGLQSQDAASWEPFLSTTDFSLNCSGWQWGKHSLLLLSYHMLQPKRCFLSFRMVNWGSEDG